MKSFLSLAPVLALVAALSACGGQKSAEQVDQDIRSAETEGAKNVADAQADALGDLAETHREVAKDQIDATAAGTTPEQRNEALATSQEKAASEVAKAEFAVTQSEIEASYRIAKERCATYPGKEKSDCIDRAKLDYDQRLASAKDQRDSAAEGPKL